MVRIVAGMALVIALVGCNTQAKWTYPLDPSVLFRSTTQPSELTLAVLPFREGRPVTNRSATFLLYLIPLMPYGWVNYERPEAARTFNTISEYEMQLDEDFAKAVTRSIEDSRLFHRVYFTFGGETKEADLILHGTARHTTYNGKIISYGLSAFGPFLWFFGLPAGTSTDLLDITLSMTDQDDHELWNYSFSQNETITQGLYYNWGNDTLQFASLLQTAMNAALQDLARQLPNIESALRSRDLQSQVSPGPAPAVRRTVRLTNPDLLAEGWGQLVGQGRRCQLPETLITQYEERARSALEASTPEVAEANRLLTIYGRSTVKAAAATDAVDCARVEQGLSQRGP